MEKGERMNVVQMCVMCEIRTVHTVICEGIHNGFEERLYSCDNCQHEEHHQVKHSISFHDKIRKSNGKSFRS